MADVTTVPQPQGKMTGVHWVSEVFRPKFEFESVDDILGKSGDDGGSPSARKDVRDVYDRVYCQSTKSSEKEIGLAIHEQASTSSERKDEGTHTEGASYQERTAIADNEGCLWDKKELSLLRKFFQKAIKLQNIRLTAMLDSSQNETKKWKQKYLTVVESLTLKKEAIRTLRKKHNRLKINYKALKEDVQGYHSKLKVAREDLKELRMDKSSVVKKLNATTAELSMMTFKKEGMESSMHQRELEFDQVIAKREFTLRQQHLLEMTSLKKDMELLKQEFETEKQENTLNKKALDQLRKHFANLQIEDTSACDRVFSVIDIDYIDSN